MLEKSLMRQKVFLHCAMDHDTVHDLNEECVHVKNTGFDIETIKRCTEHPRIVSQHSYWRHKRCSGWIGKHHWRNEPHERFGPEKSMVRTSDEEYSPPEPLTDVDEHWVEVTEDSELMCDRVQRFSPK